MPQKIPGELSAPPSASEFDRLPLARWCEPLGGTFYRLHSTNRESGQPWPPIHFGRRGSSRFDPVEGPGTLYLGETLAGTLLEIFDDHWGPVMSANRMLTQSELDCWWVSLVSVPSSPVFVTKGLALSKIGTDLQLLAGKHEQARAWALRLAMHPAKIGGIAYVSRHDHSRRNLALFDHPHLQPAILDPSLLAGETWRRKSRHRLKLIYGPAIRLRAHPELLPTLQELEVGILP